MNRSSKKIASFTVFEATVVVAIIGILLTIVSTSINRFNEQLKNTSDLNQKLNDFYMIRTGILANYYSADSIGCEFNRITFYSKNDSSVYSIHDGFLAIQKNNTTRTFNLPIAEIGEAEMNDRQYVRIEFIWTPENIQIRLPRYSFPSQSVNAFFKKING